MGRNNRIVELQVGEWELGNRCDGRGILDRVRIFLVRQPPDSDGRPRAAIEQDRSNRSSRPIAAPAAVRHPGPDHAGVAAKPVSELAYGREVAFEVATSDAEAGVEVGVLTDTLV